MSIKVVKCDTAQVVAAKQRQDRHVDIIDQGAFNGAVRKSSAKLVSLINDDIVKSWKKEAAKGSAIDVLVMDVTFEKLEKIRGALAGIEGVKGVDALPFQAARSILVVKFSGDSISLSQKINELKINGISLNVVGYSLSKVEVEVK